MPDDVYEVVSQAARYWFLFLMALIVWRSYRWFRRDRRQCKKRLRLLPDAGYVGELVVLQGNDELPEGLALPVASEGVLGCLRGDDLYVPVRGVAKKHLWYEFDEDNGLRVQPYRRNGVQVDEQSCTGRHGHMFMTHGSRLTVGDAVLRLRLFAGFEYAGVRYAPMTEQEDEAEPLAAMQPNAQPVAAVTFTPEQVAVLQQMQWAAWQAQQQAMQTGTLQTAEGEFASPRKAGYEQETLTEQDDGAYADEPPELPEDEPPRASARLRRAPLPPLAADTPGAVRRADARGLADLPEPEDPFVGEETFDPEDPFFPPIADEPPQPGEADALPPEEVWPYAPYPQSEAQFANSGYTYPEYVEPEETYEYADEDEAPRNLYVEPDEAAQAKRLLWDKYLKGGRRP